MSSETGVGKTKLLTVYHELLSARTTASDSCQVALLGLLQTFEKEHHELLLPPTHEQQPGVDNTVLAAVMQNDPEIPVTPALSVAERLRQLREHGADAAGLHSTACQIADSLRDTATDAGKQALHRFLAEVVDFTGERLLANQLLDKEQLACVLHAVLSERTADGLINSAQAARNAYLMQPQIWQAQQHDTQAAVDELQLGNIAPTDVITPETMQSVLAKLAAILTVSSLPTFQALQMHAQVSPADVWAKFNPLISLANKCPTQQFTLFIDELNTSSMMCEMKSIFIDRSFQGVKLPSNIFCVAAINPAKADAEQAPQQADGTLSFRAHYAVHPCPLSMEEVVWAFGSLSGADERDYVTAKLQMVAAEHSGRMKFSEDTCRLLMRYVTAAQVDHFHEVIDIVYR